MTSYVQIIDRATKKVIPEDIWGESSLHFLYGNTLPSKTLGRALLHTLVRWPLFSFCVGKYYDSSLSRKAIASFCTRFSIDMGESLLSIDEFTSFNDFFTRQLKPKSRPQIDDPHTCTMPADGRYSFIEHLGSSPPFNVKGESFSLSRLLGCPSLAAQFYDGTGVICRLCPADCHRFYFPMAGRADEPTWINGSLFSVSPIATKPFPWIWWTNRRAITLLETEHFGTIAYLEVGATNCGSIVQTFAPGSWVKKGEEKGNFKLGGSAIILLFEPGKITLSEDLLELKKQGLEVLCRIGQPLGFVRE